MRSPCVRTRESHGSLTRTPIKVHDSCTVCATELTDISKKGGPVIDTGREPGYPARLATTRRAGRTGDHSGPSKLTVVNADPPRPVPAAAGELPAAGHRVVGMRARLGEASLVTAACPEHLNHLLATGRNHP
ncbi:hypothetical protein AMES_2314 [Amycolatopsis mediterranei S699]|uniref:Uncharacterized protein n=1 Tax=Amycolatopsis mediterranei (strain U-32) TaxID=749927 RepID=A0A0H3CZQ4_AMYMU|nr:hypothetical protein AMED_2340 [Amycolatopsis mediterranei U32]AFO75850.1 hypothetical protein AMES_2314 [Amycolatopsis mediterranei S699]AGT82979.1 hypothetical protein B737_2315 [Amycolatopsis mediterranei RB]